MCKNRFEKFGRILSRRHKQTTFSDVGFLGILRVKQLFLKDINFSSRINKCLEKKLYIQMNILHILLIKVLRIQ